MKSIRQSFIVLFAGLLCLGGAASSLCAQESPSDRPPPMSPMVAEPPSICDYDESCCETDCCCDLWRHDSPWLTGDWGGRRTCMAENGITLDADQTMFYFGVASGGVNERYSYSGHGDLVFNFDMDKLAGRQGMFIKVRAEHRYGLTVARDAGAIIPPTISSELPLPNGEDLILTEVVFTQFLSESFGIFAGKLNTLDGDANAFASGRGKTQFSNLGFVINPIALRTSPYSTLGAGFVVMRDMQPIITCMVMNPTNTIGTSGFEDFFREGATLIGNVRLPTQFFGRPGHQCFTGTWSSRNYVALGQDPRIILPDVPITPTSGSWSLFWNMDQYVYADPCNPAWGWGYFARAGVADDQANPLAGFVSLGIGGNSILPCRENDTFGAGWYWSKTSNEIGPLLTGLLGPIGDGQAVELYYNYEVSKHFHLTADIQIIDPAREVIDTSLIFGLRAKLDF